MLKNHQDIAFFVDPFKFKLHESLKSFKNFNIEKVWDIDGIELNILRVTDSQQCVNFLYTSISVKRLCKFDAFELTALQPALE